MIFNIIISKTLTRLTYWVIFLMVTTQCLSCKKFLDKQPNSNQIVLKTIPDLQALLDNQNNMNLARTPSFGEGSSDDYYLLTAGYTGLLTESQNNYTWTPVDYIYPNDWSSSYLPIYNCNLSLEVLQTIPRTTENQPAWDNVKGSALFFRSFYFLNLVWTFSKAYDEITSTSDLGIVLRTTSDFNILTPRASVKNSYEKAIADLKEAIDLLPNTPVHPLRPSKAAVYALLARTYLSMRDYDNALQYSNLSLNIKNGLINYNNSTDPDIATSISGNNPPFRIYNRETIFYSEMTIRSLIATSRAKIDNVLYSSYEATDRRKTAFFRSNSGQQFKGMYTQNTSRYFSGLATDEMYLIRSESNARLGKISEALSDLNVLLSNRYSSFIPLNISNQEDLLNRILLERRKELLMRGLRWIDIKRLNKEGRNIILTREIGGQAYTLQPNANYYALPLPTDIIDPPRIPQNPY